MDSKRPAQSAPSGSEPDSFDRLLGRIAHAPGANPSRLPDLKIDSELLDGRFLIREKIGSGGMGVVFEAMDSLRGGIVALKTLHQLDPTRIYQLKNEFRRLADVRHPNLVTLHELCFDKERWFFTMERIHGAPFDEWARPGDALDHDRLRRAIAELARGVQKIHRSGWSHCDLKPSNVLVEESGRVRILDFGLASELRDDGEADDVSALMGTPLYMSPNRAAGAKATVEDDWWSVGVMLFKALTGQLPFAKHPSEEEARRVPAPQSIAPSVAADLAQLCGGLLAADPSRRWGWPDFSPFLSHDPQEIDEDDAVSQEVDLLGRENELAVLAALLRATRHGQPKRVCIHGLSGMGKTSLAQRFLAAARADAAVVLEGRCYEQETVPYKALDGVIDQLSAHLLRLSPSELAAVLPARAGALAQIFPVLGQVNGIGDAPPVGVANAEELRETAFLALKELIAGLATHRTVVMFVDDAHWGDADSAAALRILLEPPNAPALLFLASFRSDEAEGNPFVHALLQGEVQSLALAPLSEADMARIVTTLRPGTESARARAIAREAAGNPLLVHELVGAPPDAGRPSLAAVLLGRAAALGGSAERLLECLAVAGHSVPRATALAAAGVDESEEAVDRLRSARLVRTRSIDHNRYLETYHDRIRETLVGSLSADSRAHIHRELARAYEEASPDDHEALTEHLVGAGETSRASSHAERAGDAAVGQLAFDRAAYFFEVALRSPTNQARALSLETRYGTALSDAGRSAEATEAFLRGAQRAEGLERFDLEYRAASEMLQFGDRADGAHRLVAVMKDLGVSVPNTRAGRAWSLLRITTSLIARMSGVPHFPRRPPTERERYLLEKITPASLAILTAAAPAQFGLLGGEMARRWLASGKPDYVSRVLCGFALATQAMGARKTAQRLVDRAATVGATDRLDLSLQDMTRGTLAQTNCRFSSAADHFDRAAARLDRHPGAAQERQMARWLGFTQRTVLLDIGELRRRLPGVERRAARAGDHLELAEVAWVRIMLRQLGEAEASDELDAITEWRADTATRSIDGDARVLWGAVDIEIFAGRPTAALNAAARLQAAGPVWTVLGRIRHAMSAIACARQSGSDSERTALLQLARRRRRQLARVGQPLEPPLIDAALARAEGNDDREVAALRRVLAVAARDSTYLDRSATGAGARFRLGLLLGGDERLELHTMSARTYEDLEISQPQRARRLWNWD